MKDSFLLQNDVCTVLVMTSTVQRFKELDQAHTDTPNQMILRGITDAALEEGVSVPVQFVDDTLASNLNDPSKLPPAMQSGEVSGIIIASAYAEDILAALGTRVPCVTIPRIDSDVRADSVGPEHILGMSRLLRHLHQLGHRKIGMVGMKERAPWVVDRYAGYLYGLDEVGLKYDPDIVINMVGKHVSDKAMMKPIVEATKKGRVTAWVCVSDGMAAHVCECLQAEGIDVPDDVSITGFDGLHGIPYLPDFTTISVPWQDIGAGALHVLLQRIKNPDAAVSHLSFKGELIEGESSSRPPRS